MRFFGTHAGIHVFLTELFEMEGEFLVELIVQPLLLKEGEDSLPEDVD
jgi:hypothetical protein